MKRSTIAVLGHKGMLGTDVMTALANADFHVNGYDRPEFDITEPLQLQHVVANSDALVNCAAYTNVDGAESEFMIASKVNATAVGMLGSNCKRFNKYVIHISTDFVYDGHKTTPYTEKDPPNPVSAYGKSKYHGEQLLQSMECRYCIVRIEWTYGHAGVNFISKIRQRAVTDRYLRVVDDQIGSPTSTRDVANTLVTLLNDRIEGLYLYAAAGYASRFQVAQHILRELQLDVELTPCKTSEFKSPAERPLNSMFDCSKIESTISCFRTDWKTALSDFLN